MFEKKSSPLKKSMKAQDTAMLKAQHKILFLALTAVLFGCRANSPDSEQAYAAPASPDQQVEIKEQQAAVPVVESAQKILASKLTEKMMYDDLRKLALEQGWLPLQDPDCKQNVGGEALVCVERPETESCSGDGHCNFHFAHVESGEQLKVGAYGDQVKFWEFSVAKNETAAACPSQNFEEFLQKFSSDPQVESAFTAPFVRVTLLADKGDEGLVDYEVYQAKSDYRDFHLSHKQDGYHVVFNSEGGGSKATPIDVKQEAPDSYLVAFKHGVSEGNSYRFKQQGGCWYLVEDPEAPSP
jgi:hypothetical protein